MFSLNNVDWLAKTTSLLHFGIDMKPLQRIFLLWIITCLWVQIVFLTPDNSKDSACHCSFCPFCPHQLDLPNSLLTVKNIKFNYAKTRVQRRRDRENQLLAQYCSG